jgi:ADP-ribose pyrophosphatase YjhB (NUDIX family)
MEMPLFSDDEYKDIFTNIPRVCIDLVIVNKLQNYLMVKRKINPFKGEYWIPGGKMLYGEELHTSVKRIALQETGLECNLMYVAGVFTAITPPNELGFNDHIVSLLCMTELISGKINLDYQSETAKWVKHVKLYPKDMGMLQFNYYPIINGPRIFLDF